MSGVGTEAVFEEHSSFSEITPCTFIPNKPELQSRYLHGHYSQNA